MVVRAVKDGAVMDRPLRVAVVGGGPAGACTAETLAKAGIETYLLERKLDNCKARYVEQQFASIADLCLGLRLQHHPCTYGLKSRQSCCISCLFHTSAPP